MKYPRPSGRGLLLIGTHSAGVARRPFSFAVNNGCPLPHHAATRLFCVARGKLKATGVVTDPATMSTDAAPQGKRGTRRASARPDGIAPCYPARSLAEWNLGRLANLGRVWHFHQRTGLDVEDIAVDGDILGDQGVVTNPFHILGDTLLLIADGEPVDVLTFM
jgi:hypothetical protein